MDRRKRMSVFIISVGVFVMSAFFAMAGFDRTALAQGEGLTPSKVIPQIRPDTLKPMPQRDIPVAGEYIPCPFERVVTEVTTPLPQPWWNTPQEGELVRVEMMNVGGVPTLVCAYRAYGTTVSIMREIPAGKMSCTSQEKGFLCR